MKNALRTWRGVLQLDEQTLRALKQSRYGMRYAALQFLVVTLIAGLGIWLGLPAILQKPLLSERIERIETQVRQFQAELTPAIYNLLDRVSEEHLREALAAATSPGEGVSGERLTALIRQAGLTGSQVRAALSTRLAALGADARTAAEPVLAALAARIDAGETIPADEIEKALEQVGASATEVAGALEQQVQSVGSELQVQGASRWATLLAQLPFSGQGVETVVSRQVLLSDRGRDAIVRL
ncbi:MAG: hypothetical protein ACRC1H_02145, partial [Caldilineaceae bacterium]